MIVDETGNWYQFAAVVVFVIGAQTHNDGSLGTFLYVLGCSIAVREAEPIVGNPRLFRQCSFSSINRFRPKEVWLMGSRVVRHVGAREGRDSRSAEGCKECGAKTSTQMRIFA